MKKTIISLAFAAISLVTFNGMAQTTTTNTDNTVKKECCMKDGKKCDKDMKGKKGPKDGKQFKGKKSNPFDGLKLTDAQKTKLQELDNKQKAARQEMAKAKKDDKQRNDSVKMAERKAAKKSYLEEVKAIIGPENYVVFLENMYINGGGQPRGNKAFIGQGQGPKDKGMRNGKGDRRGDHGQKHASKGEKKSSGNAKKS